MSLEPFLGKCRRSRQASVRTHHHLDTVDRFILDCALGLLGLPDWFRKVYFSFHSQVRLRFKLAAASVVL